MACNGRVLQQLLRSARGASHGAAALRRALPPPRAQLPKQLTTSSSVFGGVGTKQQESIFTTPPQQFQGGSSRIAVVGAGSVGAAVCYGLQLRQVASELLVVDADPKRAKGEVDDLSDGAFITNSRVRVGTTEEAGQCDIIVITAGAKQREGESRVELIGRNLTILKSIFRDLRPTLKPSAKILVVANPCDVLTYFAQKLAHYQLPQSQVFGSGTFLDTARLREFIAKKAGVAETAVHIYALGTSCLFSLLRSSSSL